MGMTPAGYAFLGLTTIVACLVAVLAFALLRFMAAARDARKGRAAGESDMLASALQDAVERLKAQERATAARAEASERLSGEIISGLSAGLLVVGLEGDIRILNPAGRRMLELPDSASPETARRALDELALFTVIDECMRTRLPVVRRSVTLPEPQHGISHIGITVSPLVDDGQLHGAICLFTDLTAVKALEEQLRLKNSLATVGELTAGIAHEFRNGLATTHGYSKLLYLEALPESYRPYVEGIRAEAESLGQVVTNFLN